MLELLRPGLVETMTRKVEGERCRQTTGRRQQSRALVLEWKERRGLKEKRKHYQMDPGSTAVPRGGFVVAVVSRQVVRPSPEAALMAGWRRRKSCQRVSLSDVLGTGSTGSTGSSSPVFDGSQRDRGSALATGESGKRAGPGQVSRSRDASRPQRAHVADSDARCQVRGGEGLKEEESVARQSRMVWWDGWEQGGLPATEIDELYR